ncbi:MAG TPA: acetoacetate decarboxylase family protein [Streptosporangiaceae bacterium]
MARLNGFLFPRTATGTSSLLPAPPWHYSGDLLTIEYRTDPAAVAELLPDPLQPPLDSEDPGAVAVVFADWQSCSDTFEEVLDPVRLQYKEAFVVVRCRYQGRLWSRCVYIWVDKDFALARGHLQGYPKKLGSIYLTRPVTVGRAGPRLQPGGRFGATVAAADRRLITARFTITGPSDGAGFVNALPMLHHRYLPRIEADGRDSVAEMVTMRGTGVELGPAFAGTAELELLDSPVEELTRLAPQELIGGYYRSVGTTFSGGETLA